MKFPLFICAMLAPAGLWAQSAVLDPFVVTADRTAEPASQVAFSVTTLDAQTLRSSPGLTVDDVLRSVPEFSLFRRDGSLTANPTTQGLSLRGLGPSGASRSLVLLDGIPLNDPFGGWITWSEIPRESLASAELVPGGGATAWGNSALGGVVQLFTDPLEGDHDRIVGSAGSFRTRSGEFEVNQPAGDSSLQLLGSAFATDGYRLVAPASAGPIDVPAASQHSWIEGRWRQPLGPTIEATLTVRSFEEARNNGTPYQENWTRENFSSVTLRGAPAGFFSWNAAAYAQNGNFASTYSSVNATRTAETPAEDQYSVPSTAVGGAWTGTWKSARGARTNLGVDGRDVRGETREDYSFVSGAYADQRLAGGRQSFGGIFLLREQPVTEQIRLSFGGRLDDWRETDGHLLETVRSTGVALTDNLYTNHTGTEFSPTAGATWQLSQAWRLRADAQQSFRVPTLNELYRPFRQGSNITEANPNLKTEHATSGELGLDWSQGEWKAGVAGFANQLKDAVDAVTVATGPATVPGIGVIPAGGAGLERLNLDRVRVEGAQAYAEWTLSDQFKLRADYLRDDTDITRASVAPTLVGNQLVQVPKDSASLSAVWRASGKLTITPRIRWIGSQYNDDQNLLRLSAAVVEDMAFTFEVTRGLEVFLNAENLGNEQVQTGLSTTGVANVGAPRMILGGLRLSR